MEIFLFSHRLRHVIIVMLVCAVSSLCPRLPFWIYCHLKRKKTTQIDHTDISNGFFLSSNSLVASRKRAAGSANFSKSVFRNSHRSLNQTKTNRFTSLFLRNSETNRMTKIWDIHAKFVTSYYIVLGQNFLSISTYLL